MDNQIQAAYRRMLELRRVTPVTAWSDLLRNALRQAARHLAQEQEAPFFPPQIYIEPTNACNCNCVICPRRNMTRPVGYMALDLYRSIVEQAAALGPSDVNLFNFGEPTLHPDLPEMVRFAAGLRLETAIQTNGLLGDERALRALLEAGLRRIGVSVNGLTPSEYEAIRPGHKFERLLANLGAIRRAIDESGGACRLNIAAQALKEDMEKRPGDVEQYKRVLGPFADSVSIFGISRYAGISLPRSGRIEQPDAGPAPRRPDEQVKCCEPFDRLVVKWDGRATVCCADFDAQLVVGDLAREPFADVWNGAAIRRVRDLVKARQYSRLALCCACPKFCSDQFTVVFRREPTPGA